MQGYIEDTRKLMPDFLAPELRAISVRLDSLETLVEANERRAEQHPKEAIHQAVLDRLARLVSKQNVSAA